jgi:hypothetical protein
VVGLLELQTAWNGSFLQLDKLQQVQVLAASLSLHCSGSLGEQLHTQEALLPQYRALLASLAHLLAQNLQPSTDMNMQQQQ